MPTTLDTIDSPEDFIYDPSLVLYLPLHKLDGASFMSKDAYGHLCTVTGALWRPNGREFDGVDDYIDCENAVSLQPTSFTIFYWFKPGASVYTKAPVSKQAGNYGFYTDVTGSEQARIAMWNGVSGVDVIWVAVPYEIGVWIQIAFTYDATTDAVKSYANGVYSKGGGSDTYADYSPDTTKGLWVMRLGNAYAQGTFGELIMYSRALSDIEIHRNYLTTKWRYK